MQYRKNPRTGAPLSALGFGCMRFPSDAAVTEQLILQAVAQGVNYFDTAYVYPGSEQRLGDILAKHKLREKVNIATKLPLFLVRKAEDFDRYFLTQCKRLKTDTIDYYLLHMLPDVGTWDKLCAMGIADWIAQKKKSGAIGQIGFSFHGKCQDFLDLLDAYDWDFCQIQYNYMDEHNQAGKKGLQRAAQKGLPVIIMEPLLGGNLATRLPPKALEAFGSVNPAASPAKWAFTWLYDQPEVTCVLSGMNEVSQLEENLQIASTATQTMLTEREQAAFAQVKQILSQAQKVPCTACGYCMPCPNHVNIPGCFAAYNVSYANGWKSGVQQYFLNAGVITTTPATASHCIGCGKCEKHCPQSIHIRDELQAVQKRLEPLWMKAGIAIARTFMGK